MDSARSAILFTPRPELREILVEEAAALACANVMSPRNVEECVEQIVTHPEAVLVVDWETGAVEVNQVLGAIKGHFSVETRPVFLLTPEVDTRVVAVGAEFGVSRVHSGPLSRLTIREGLEALFTEDESTRGVKTVLIQVAELRSRNDWGNATTLLEQALSQYPGQERLALELAENLIHEDRWQDALSRLEPLVTREPPSIRAMHLASRCYMRLKRTNDAIRVLEKAKIINPHNIERLIDLGNACLTANRISDALKNFEAALEIDGEDKRASVGKGKTLLVMGEVNEALNLLKGMSGPRELASIFNTAAILSMRSGGYNHGFELYRAALQAIGEDEKLQARLVFNMGLGFVRSSQADKAMACFEYATKLDPDFMKAKRHRDLTEARLGSQAASSSALRPWAEQGIEALAEEGLTSGRAVGSDTSAFVLSDEDDEF